MKTRGNPLLKKLDFYIGVPLLFIFGLFHRKRKKVSDSPRRIAIIKTGGLGDAVLTEACVHEIKTNYPDCKITYVCTNATKAMVPAIARIDDVYIFNLKAPLQSMQGLKQLGKFDCVFDFGPWPRLDAIIAWNIKADYRVGFKRRKMYRHYIYDKAVEHRDDLHELDNYRNLLRVVGMKIHGFLPQLKTEQKRFITGDYVVFHPYPAGSSVHLREWSNANWLELAKRINQRYAMPIYISGGPSDQEQADSLVEAMKNEDIQAYSIAGQYKIAQMATVLSQARLVVSVNTGIMHMAAAVDVPLVGLHGATSILRWGPLGGNSIALAAGEACQPCISLGFESKCTNPVCMQHLTVDKVFQAVNQLMGDK